MPSWILLHTHSVIAFVIALSHLAMFLFLMNVKADFPALRWMRLNYFAGTIWYIDQMVRFSMYPGSEGSLTYKTETILVFAPILVCQMYANVQIAYLFIESMFEKEKKIVLNILVLFSIALFASVIWNEIFNGSNFFIFQVIAFVWGILLFIFTFSITYRKARAFRRVNNSAYSAYLLISGAYLSFIVLSIVCLIYDLFSPVGYWTYFILIWLGEFSLKLAYLRYSQVFVGFQLKITAYSLLMIEAFIIIFSLVFLPPLSPTNIAGRLQQQEGLEKVFLIIIASIIVTILILPSLLKRTLTRPLKQLLEAVQSVNAGNLNIELPVLYQDEIGSLTSQFNTMTNSLQQKNNKLIEYSHTLSELYNNQQKIQEQTLNHVSQEIHDNVGQMLSLVRIQLNLAAQQENKENKIISDAQENIGRAMMDLRDLAKGMSSDRIKLLGLYASVEQEVERIRRAGICEVQMNCEGVKRSMDHQREIILFRVLQECLQNVMKHSEAKNLDINFTYTDNVLSIQIKDDGKGFLIQPAKGSYGLGLMNINNRIQLMNGQITVESSPGTGTVIFIQLPIE
jgi:two-component system NarL family sensor kinase